MAKKKSRQTSKDFCPTPTSFDPNKNSLTGLQSSHHWTTVQNTGQWLKTSVCSPKGVVSSVEESDERRSKGVTAQVSQKA